MKKEQCEQQTKVLLICLVTGRICFCQKQLKERKQEGLRRNRLRNDGEPLTMKNKGNLQEELKEPGAGGEGGC